MPSQEDTRSDRTNPNVKLVAALASALVLGACQTGSSTRGALFGGSSSSPEITGSIGVQQPSLSATQKWAKAWEKDSANVGVALNYAANLNAIGSGTEALRVLKETYARNPRNQAIAAAYGKQLATSGELPAASEVLAKAQAMGRPDWRLYSAQGTVYDRMGEHKRAQSHYAHALKLNPGKTTILNNLGMSYALAGDLKSAEKTLKSAVDRDSKNPTARQNLALVIGLQGRFDEAEDVASKDLPPNLVAANMQFLRTMLSQQNVWDKLKKKKSG